MPPFIKGLTIRDNDKSGVEEFVMFLIIFFIVDKLQNQIHFQAQ